MAAVSPPRQFPGCHFIQPSHPAFSFRISGPGLLSRLSATQIYPGPERRAMPVRYRALPPGRSRTVYLRYAALYQTEVLTFVRLDLNQRPAADLKSRLPSLTCQ